MATRRTFFQAVLSFLGLTTIGSSVKAVSADPDVSILVVSLPEDMEQPTDEEVERFRAKVQALCPGCRIAIVPPGVDIWVLPTGGVYHRERFDGYEVEVVAKTEEDLRRRMETVQPGYRSQQRLEGKA